MYTTEVHMVTRIMMMLISMMMLKMNADDVDVDVESTLLMMMILMMFLMVLMLRRSVRSCRQTIPEALAKFWRATVSKFKAFSYMVRKLRSIAFQRCI